MNRDREIIVPWPTEPVGPLESPAEIFAFSTMSQDPPLPDLHQSDIDEATLRRLIADIGTHAEIPQTLQLDEAFQLLANRTVRGLQLRCRYAGKTWWDTLMPLPGGLFRIVRIEHHFS